MGLMPSRSPPSSQPSCGPSPDLSHLCEETVQQSRGLESSTAPAAGVSLFQASAWAESRVDVEAGALCPPAFVQPTPLSAPP